MKNLFCLENKTALITGGGGLLGEKHAEAILEVGGNVILADYSKERALNKAEALNSKFYGERVSGCYMDVTDLSSIKEVCSQYDNVDILINNAAKNPKVKSDSKEEWFSHKHFNRFETMPLEYFKEGLDVIVNGTFLVSQAIANKMIENKINGVMLNISSDLSVIAPDQRIYKADPDESFDEQNVKPIFYSAAKWSVLGITKYLSTYLSSKNIRVNSLSPGGVYDNHPSDFVSKLSNLIPLNRMANVDEYKGAVIFACSEASSYMTGHNLIVDGGRSVW